MTHQLLLNFDACVAQTKYYPQIPDVYTSIVREAIETIITRHGAALWGRNQIMTGPVDLLRGSDSITLEAKSRRLSARLGDVDVQAAKYDRQGVIDALVENVVAEFTAEFSRGDMAFYPYHLLIPSALITDPDTLSPVVTLTTRYATLPSREAKPVTNLDSQDESAIPLEIAIT
jgi:hypothetical protein